ncbi:MAG: type II secretion system protein [Opitutus sp.]|nr:type II secretion system protein [Opitutus sp.]
MMRPFRQFSLRATRVGRVIPNPPLRPPACGRCFSASKLAAYGERRVRENVPYLHSAFTLVELMVVTSLIALLTAGVGMALRGRGGEGVALANAQKILIGLVGSARAQAALHQTSARVLVYASLPPAGDAGKYLRYLQVARLEGTAWVAAGDPVTLPTPICVVPPSPVPTTHLRTGVTWVNTPATGPVSTLSLQRNFSVSGQSAAANLPGARPVPGQLFGGTGGGTVYFLQLEADGTVSSNTTGNPTKIALATAVLAPAAIPQFNNASGVRGLFVRKTGAVSLVNDATGF